MNMNYRPFMVTVLAGWLSLSLGGCETKAAQCNKLTKIANAATAEMQKTSQDQDPDKIAVLKKMSTSLAGYSKQIGDVKLEDEKLQGFQKRFITLYQSVGTSSRDLADAAGKKDMKAAQASLKTMSAGATQETTLISEVNQYCGGK
jgi:hypothetical protein